LGGLSDAIDALRAVLLAWRARLSARPAGVAVVYHRIGGQTSGDASREILADLSTPGFRSQVRHLSRHYRVVGAGELLEAVRQRRRGERIPVSITFDDDLAAHIRTALQELRTAGVTATFFLGGVSLEGPHAFWWQDLQCAVDDRLVAADSLPHVPEAELHAALEREPKAIFRVAAAIEELQPERRLETAAALRAAVGERSVDEGLRAHDIQALVAGGCDVGFHTLRHESLTSLDQSGLESALQDGRDTLAAVVGSPLNAIAYPHGKADKRVAEAARAAGYTVGFVTGRRAVTPEMDPLLLPRIPPALSTGKTMLRIARAVASSASH
jgi:peptidoglycan/xylan/chitin deacetylase (PgdA/CDA1 family)